MVAWKPKEIIVHEKVRNDPVTIYFIQQCPGVSVKYTSSGIPKEIVQVFDILSHSGSLMLDKILAGKQVVYIAPATTVVNVFTVTAALRFAKNPLQSGKNWECRYPGAAVSASWIT